MCDCLYLWNIETKNLNNEKCIIELFKKTLTQPFADAERTEDDKSYAKDDKNNYFFIEIEKCATL